MKLKLKHNKLETLESRQKFAKMLSCIIEGADQEYLPYMPNDGDHSFWTLDSNNDWKVGFDSGGEFRVIYRYQSESSPYEEGLVEWLKVKFEYSLDKVNF